MKEHNDIGNIHKRNLFRSWGSKGDLTYLEHDRHFWTKSPGYLGEIHKKLTDENAERILGRILLDNLSMLEIMQILIKDKSRSSRARLSDINKARLLVVYPDLEKIFEVDKFDIKVRLGLYVNDPNTYGRYIDFNNLTHNQYKYLLNLNTENPRIIKHVIKSTKTKQFRKMFTVDMWKKLITIVPYMKKEIDISSLRNKSKVKDFILENPNILKYATLNDLENSVIDAIEWIRIVAEFNEENKKYVPNGFVAWAEKETFKDKLKGKKFSKYPKNWRDGLSDGK